MEIHSLFLFLSLSRLQTWALLYILRQISQVQSHSQHPHLSYPHTPNLVTKSSNYFLNLFYLDPLSLLLYNSHSCCLIYCNSPLFYLLSVVPPSRTIQHPSSSCGAVAWFLYPQHHLGICWKCKFLGSTPVLSSQKLGVGPSHRCPNKLSK